MVRTLTHEAKRLVKERTTIVASSEIRIIGPDISVCAVVKTGVPPPPATKVDQVIGDSTGRATLGAVVVLGDGRRVRLERQIYQWLRSGQISGEGEVALCVGPVCGVDPPVGEVVNRVEIETTVPFEASGVYFTSRPLKRESQSSPAPRVGCST